MRNLIKKPVFIISAIIVVLIGGYVYFSRSKKPTYEFDIAKKTEVIQEVSVTGRVKPAESVDLAFEKSGKVARIYVNVGDKVTSGQLLMSLNNADLSAQLAQAEASARVQKSKLDELKVGTRLEDIEVKKSELKKAQQDLVNDYESVIDVLNDAYNKTDDAVRKQVSDLFSNSEESNPQLTFITPNSQAEIDVEFQRFMLSHELNKWNDELNQLDIVSSLNLLDQGLENAKSRLILTRNFLTRLMDTVIGNVNLTQTTINTYKTNINTARTNINTALASVNDQAQTIASQKITVETIQNELNLKLAGSTPEEIAAQEAEVEDAEANVLNYQAQLAKTILRSPINGIVTLQDTELGEIVSANTIILSVISSAKFEIEVNVPEADIAKVKIDNPAKVTLDAYGNDVLFEAKVISIYPAENIIEGVATYKTKLQFTKENEQIKSGMTANIDILTDKHENVIAIPQRAVISQNGAKIVKIMNEDNSISEVKVKTGLRGSDGNIEIIEGIKEGDKVIIAY